MLNLIIIFHEYGHAFTAKINNIKVSNINIGFGKLLLKYSRPNKPSWQIKAIPIGGFIEINLTNCKNILTKFSIILSGSIFNIILTWVILVIATVSIKTGSAQFVQLLTQLLEFTINWQDLGGLISWFELINQAWAAGWQQVLLLFAKFNLILGIINLVPLPGLDGGEILYAIIEKICKKPISFALKRLITELFWIMIAVLLAQVTIREATRISFIS